MRTFYYNYESVSDAIKEVKRIAKYFKLCDGRRMGATIRRAAEWLEDSETSVTLVFMSSGVVLASYDASIKYQANEFTNAIAVLQSNAGGCSMTLGLNVNLQ